MTDPSLVVTIAPYVNGPVCGTESTLIVNQGDFVTFCYTYTNHTGRTLPWQYFSDTKGITSYGPGFPMSDSLADGQSKTLFNTAYIFQSQDVAVTWVGLGDNPPRYNFDDTVSFDWIELTASATAEHLPIDTARPYADAQVQMPFSIDFYGFPTDGKLCVDKNGTLRFHSGLPALQVNTGIFPTSRLLSPEPRCLLTTEAGRLMLGVPSTMKPRAMRRTVALSSSGRRCISPLGVTPAIP